jgi:hypothetical protein
LSGLIDRLFPPLDALDQALSGVLPPLVRLVLYGAASGAITMVVYRLTSDQNGILALKERMRDLRGQLKVAADDFAQTMQLSRENLGVSMHLLFKSLWPALVSSLPVVVIIAWLAMSWSQPLPAAGTAVPLSYQPPTAGLATEPADALSSSPGGGMLRWPAAEAPAVLKDASGAVYEGLGSKPPASVIHKRVWWNAILGNPAGYLPDNAAVEEVRLELPEREVLHAGPGWARGFELTYFAVVVAFSLVIKFIFKIA